MTSAALVSLVLVVLGFPACGGQGAARNGGETRAPRKVALVEVGTTPMPRTVAVTGVLAAQDELVLGMQVGGRLATLAVDVGDPVAKDAVLAALDPRDFQLEQQPCRAERGQRCWWRQRLEVRRSAGRDGDQKERKDTG